MSIKDYFVFYAPIICISILYFLSLQVVFITIEPGSLRLFFLIFVGTITYAGGFLLLYSVFEHNVINDILNVYKNYNLKHDA